MTDACIIRHHVDGDHHKTPHLYEWHTDKKHLP